MAKYSREFKKEALKLSDESGTAIRIAILHACGLEKSSYGPLHILHSVFSIFCLLGSVWLIFCCRSYSLHLAVTSFSATTFAAEGNSIVSWAEISNAPETSQHRNGWHPNGFDMVFGYFSLPCSAIWFFRPTLWQAVRKICVKQSNCFGHSVFRGDGHIREVYSRIGGVQFSFGFYSLMLTSLLIGLIVMIFFKPRTWCAFCPMGTMTQAICKLRNRKRGK